MDELITIPHCRELRAAINQFTNGCILTESEYQAIMKVLKDAVERMERKQ